MPDAVQDQATLRHRIDQLVVIGQCLLLADRLLGELGIVGSFIPAVVKVAARQELQKDRVHAFFCAPVDHAERVCDRWCALDAHAAVAVGSILDDRRLWKVQCVDRGDDLAIVAGAKVAYALPFEERIDAKQHAARVAASDEQPAALCPYRKAVVPGRWCQLDSRWQRHLVAQAEVGCALGCGCGVDRLDVPSLAGQAPHVAAQLLCRIVHYSVSFGGPGGDPSDAFYSHVRPPCRRLGVRRA